jgi:hypothetical protein
MLKLNRSRFNSTGYFSMEDNRYFAHFRDTDGTFFNADAVKIIHASKAIVVQFLLLKTHFIPITQTK